MSNTDIPVLDAYFEKRIKEGWAEGFAAAISNAEKVVFASYVGESAANIEGATVPISRRLRFNIGSVTKPFTAVLLAK